MTDFNYKKYSLENLEKWVEDAISSSDATPQEIYDVFVKVARENHEYHTTQASRMDELLTLLNSNGQSYEDVMKEREYYEPESKGVWNDFWDSNSDVEYNLREAEYYNSSVELPPNQSYIGWQTMSDDKFNQEFPPRKDKVNRWVLPVQVDGLTGECYINLPDDLLERAGLKEGDMVHWIDRNDGSFEMRKVNGTK